MDVSKRCADCPLKDEPLVPGFGNRDHPKICVVAEAPGAEEVKAKPRQPLVGKSGQLLRSVLRDLGVDDKELYYTNMLQCRPPDNRPPTAAESNVCYDRLIQELEEVKPDLIVTLGNTSTKRLAKYEKGITTVRGRYRTLVFPSGMKVGSIPTFHPAAVLRDPDKFRDLVADLDKAISIAVKKEPAVVFPPTENYWLVSKQGDLDRLFPILEKAGMLSVDLETISRDFKPEPRDGLLTIGISWGAGKSCSIDWQNLIARNGNNFERMQSLLMDHPISFQTASFDYVWLVERNITPRLAFDTEIAHWLVDERPAIHSLAQMATHYFRAPDYKAAFRRRNGLRAYISDEEQFGALFAKIPLLDVMEYNATDADYTWQLAMVLGNELKSQGLLKLQRLLLKATMLYADLKMEGMWVDLDYLDKFEAQLDALIAEAKKPLLKMAPEVNWNSVPQLQTHLYDKLKLTPIGGGKADGHKIPEGVISAAIKTVDDVDAQEYWQTQRVGLYEGAGTADSGRGLSSRSTAAYMLWWLAQQHPYPRAVLKLKAAQKLKNTYCKNLRKHLWSDIRIRPDYKLDGTLNGRFKSSDPAVHNIPTGSDFYNVYTAPPGWTILHCDYHQADMRVLAHFSRDPVLKEWLKIDPHTELVKEIYHLTHEEAMELKRKRPKRFAALRIAAKMVNFGLPYGRSAKNLAPQMGMSVEEAQAYIVGYWRRLRVLKRWIDDRPRVLTSGDQELVSPYGNKRRFPLITGRTHLRECGRLAVNFPVMASVNYMTMQGQLHTVEELRRLNIPVKVYPHIHDSANICVKDEDVQRVLPIMAEAFHEAPLSVGIDYVPFPVEITGAFRWGDAQTTSLYDG